MFSCPTSPWVLNTGVGWGGAPTPTQAPLCCFLNRPLSSLVTSSGPSQDIKDSGRPVESDELCPQAQPQPTARWPSAHGYTKERWLTIGSGKATCRSHEESERVRSCPWRWLSQGRVTDCPSLPRTFLVLLPKVPSPRKSLSPRQTEMVGHPVPRPQLY